MPDRNQSLAGEARHLHACLFHRPADDAVVARYQAAHRELFSDEDPSPLMDKIVARRLDAEAIEFALRRRGQGRELTRKLQIVSYLQEARAEYLAEFVNFKSSRIRAWSALAAATLGAAWKRTKGEYSIRRHGLL